MSIIQALRERSELLNVSELAALLRVAEDTIQGWARRRQIPTIKIGKIIRFDGKMLADWVELQGACTHPIVTVFLHPRAPGDPADFRMLTSDLGPFAPRETATSASPEPVVEPDAEIAP